MKKLLVCCLLVCCLFGTGCGRPAPCFGKDHPPQIVSKTTWCIDRGLTVYVFSQANPQINLNMHKTSLLTDNDWGDVGDFVIYSNKALIAVKEL